MRHRFLLLLGLLAAAAWLYWPAPTPKLDDELSADAGVKLHNRVWAQRMPKSERDLVQYVIFARKRGMQLGSAQVASRWRSRADGFRWKARKGQIDLEFPQEQQKLRVSARTWRCKGKAPKPFTVCLELKRATARPPTTAWPAGSSATTEPCRPTSS